MSYIQTGYLMPDKFISNIALHFTEGKPVPENFHLNGVPRQDKHQLWARRMLAENMLLQTFPQSGFDYVKKRDMGGERVILLQFRKVDIDDLEESCEYKQLQQGFHPEMVESEDSRKLRDWVLDHFWELKNESEDSFEWYYEYDLWDESGIKTGPPPRQSSIIWRLGLYIMCAMLLRLFDINADATIYRERLEIW